MQTIWPEDIGRVAKQQRVDLGISQDELAARAGVTRQWISRFEQGKADVSLTKAMLVLRELELVVDLSSRSGMRRPAASSFSAGFPTINIPSFTISPEMREAVNDAVRNSLDTAKISRAAAEALERLSANRSTTIDLPLATQQDLE